MSLLPSVRDLGRTLWTGSQSVVTEVKAHVTDDDGDETAEESEETSADRPRVETGDGGDQRERDPVSTGSSSLEGRSGPFEATPETASETAERIGEFVASVDPKYTAKVAYDGTKKGLRAGPYGALAGAGAGVIYGAYSSNREGFDPDDPSGALADELSITELKAEYATAATGYRYGKRLGLYGGLVGTALGAGVDVLSNSDADDSDADGTDGTETANEADTTDDT